MRTYGRLDDATMKVFAGGHVQWARFGSGTKFIEILPPKAHFPALLKI